MPRERSLNYDAKTQQIKDMAAKHFAKVGYPAAKLTDIAKSCGVSKSVLYHYFPTKDDILFSMINDHLESIQDALRKINAKSTNANISFKRFLEVFLENSATSRQHNIVAMSDAKYLPKNHLKTIQKKENTILNFVTQILQELNPSLSEELYKPYALMLIGVLNWTDTWFHAKGSITHEQLVERVGKLFLHGFLSAGNHIVKTAELP